MIAMLWCALASAEPAPTVEDEPLVVEDLLTQRLDLEQMRRRSATTRAAGFGLAGLGVAAIGVMASDPAAEDQSAGLIASLGLVAVGLPLGIHGQRRHRRAAEAIIALELKP